MHPRNPHPYVPTADEASAWADTLVRSHLLHAAVLVPTGQWLVQHDADSPVQLLSGPVGIIDLAAEIQHRIRTTRNHTR